MQIFDPFVLPFTLGLVFLLGTLAVTYIGWVKSLPDDEFVKVKRGLFTVKTLHAMREVFYECLLHRKVFKVNPWLGYMHTSLAFGWFMLILVGNWESRIFYDGHVSPPYVPIFFRFFNPNPTTFPLEGAFSFLMDLILLVVLSGVALAWFKRLYSRFFGMKKTTVLRLGDKLALTALWLIFPFRFLAESFASGVYGGGHFLTSNAGNFFAAFLPVRVLVYPAWWAYSSALGLFFVALPWSRYMHIPTEVLLIFLRKYGVSEKSEFTSYTQVEVKACSRCGVCIDTCQLASAADIKGVQSVYQLQNIRNREICGDKALNCLMCGRCDNVCPVGIDIQSIRMADRRQSSSSNEKVSYGYISPKRSPQVNVVYFAGCMTHLQPSVKKSMIKIMDAAQVHFWLMDEVDGVCCGRPLILSGNNILARELMAWNKKAIEDSGAKTLVTSCPICYKVFKEEYNLTIEVLHHSQFLLNLIESKKITVNQQSLSAVYHDPCELGRGSGIYAQPRKLLNGLVHLLPVDADKQDALCCGGSLANLKISEDNKKLITRDALSVLTANSPDVLVTACPMCKSTFSKSSSIRVMDIAEVLSKSLAPKSNAAQAQCLKSKRVDVKEGSLA